MLIRPLRAFFDEVGELDRRLAPHGPTGPMTRLFLNSVLYDWAAAGPSASSAATITSATIIGGRMMHSFVDTIGENAVSV